MSDEPKSEGALSCAVQMLNHEGLFYFPNSSKYQPDFLTSVVS